MPTFGKRSLKIRDELHPDLRVLVDDAITFYDFSLIEGHRGKGEQSTAFRKGLSKLQYPDSKHNKIPSEAFHAIPYPFHGWDNTVNFAYMAGIFFAVANVRGIGLRWGGNWDRDGEVITDQGFDDLAHFELDQGEIK